MSLQQQISSIVNLVLHCPYCQPHSGCILSGLKGLGRVELRSHLSSLSDKAREKIFSYHEHCLYQNRVL
jgi:hypothetical protein